MFTSPSKKAKSFDFEMAKSSKTPLYTLAPPKMPAQRVELPQAAGQKRKAEEPAMTPDTGIDSSKSRRVEPSSAPAPAGRSPKSKKIGILSRRRMTSSPFTRINPPAFSTGDSKNGLPFSIDAALAGTVPIQKSKSKSKGTLRKSWQFEIHEDTPDDELTNLMQHSTCTLDISDDEGRNASKEDKDNKENIPPLDGPASLNLSATQIPATQIPATRRDMMTDETRNPLGDLNAEDFYAKGCDASSFIIAAEDSNDLIDDKLCTANNFPETCSAPHPLSDAVAADPQAWHDLVAQIAAKSATNTAETDLGLGAETLPHQPTDIQIWESESAKGDDDVDAHVAEVEATNHQSLLA